VLYDPAGDRAFARELLDAVFCNRRYKRAAAGELEATPLPPPPAGGAGEGPRRGRRKGRRVRAAVGEAPAAPAVEATLLRDDSRNTSLARRWSTATATS
jgi:hypothetical protein